MSPFGTETSLETHVFFLNNACDCIILAILGVECKDFELRDEDEMVVDEPFRY
jgi:hypothetical protein